MVVSLFPKLYKGTGILSKLANQKKNEFLFVLYLLWYCLFIPLGITRAYSFRLESLSTCKDDGRRYNGLEQLEPSNTIGNTIGNTIKKIDLLDLP